MDRYNCTHNNSYNGYHQDCKGCDDKVECEDGRVHPCKPLTADKYLAKRALLEPPIPESGHQLSSEERAERIEALKSEEAKIRDEQTTELIKLSNAGKISPQELDIIYQRRIGRRSKFDVDDKKPSGLKIQGYTVKPIKEVYAMEEIDRKWVWDGILPADGLSLLTAKPKVGKSTLLKNLAVKVALGQSFLGRNTMKGKVVVLALEESQSEIRASLMKVYPEPPENLYYHFGSAPRDALGELIPLIQELKPVLVGIDIAQKFLRVKNGQYEEVIEKLEPVMDVARKLNTHILLNHHAGKNDRELIDTAIGSTGYAASVDTVIVLKDTKPIRVMSTIQRYHKEGQPDIENEVVLLDRDGFTLTQGGNKTLMDREAAKNKILHELGQIGDGKFYSEPMTYNQIATATHKSLTDIVDLMRALFEEEKVKRIGTGKKGDAYRFSL